MMGKHHFKILNRKEQNIGIPRKAASNCIYFIQRERFWYCFLASLPFIIYDPRYNRRKVLFSPSLLPQANFSSTTFFSYLKSDPRRPWTKFVAKLWKMVLANNSLCFFNQGNPWFQQSTVFQHFTKEFYSTFISFGLGNTESMREARFCATILKIRQTKLRLSLFRYLTKNDKNSSLINSNLNFFQGIN